MRQPYIKLYKTVGKFKVYIVDGSFIRKNLNEEFTNFAQHYRFPRMIPVREFWMDNDHGYHGNHEYEFFINHMLTENKLMNEGKSYTEALKEADKIESHTRHKEKHYPVKIKVLKEVGDVVVWLVCGAEVRNHYNVDFTEGGHDLVYNWIPKNEIWIDDQLPKDERDAVILHEMYERGKMQEHIEYPSAHISATIVEKKYRKHRKLPDVFRNIFATVKVVK